MTNRLLFLLVLVMLSSSVSAQQLYKTEQGTAYFLSDAPLETIEAKSERLRGVIDPRSNSFAFSIQIHSFEGFNSPLQREHFNENYLESKIYERATFSGKIIEEYDLTADGSYTVRAKGMLDIHGVEQERIIRSEVVTKDGVISLKAAFTVLLSEHDIRIPRIVYQKIAEEIQVEINAELKAE
jgi:hypothetical protein